jgi:hypothetical protein
VKLSDHFYLHEFTRSQSAERHGIDNTPDEAVIANLTALCVNVLEPVRKHFGPININSGYRSLPVNALLGSKPTSQHVTGHAADIECASSDNAHVADWIRRRLKFDQLILEFHTPGDPHSGWVHVSWVSPEKNRNQVLTITRQGTFTGLVV